MTDATLVHDLPLVTLRQVAVTAMDNNVYLLTSKQTGAQVLVDAAGEPDTITGLLTAARVDSPRPTRLVSIITTHRHLDHIGALAEMVARTGAQTLAGAADADAIEQATGVPTGRRLVDGDRVSVDDIELEVVGLQGHTPGSVALVHRSAGHPVVLLSGDSLFPGGPGKTTSPADFDSLMTDLEQRVFARYGDDTVVLPGHGRSTTLGAERPQLPQWWARRW